MATAIDNNAAYEKSDKSIWRLLNIRCTSSLFIYAVLVFLAPDILVLVSNSRSFRLDSSLKFLGT